MYLTNKQSIDLWDTLLKCYYKVNSYGGNECEIYVSSLINDAHYLRNSQVSKDHLLYRDVLETEINAFKSAYEIFLYFMKKYEVELLIESVTSLSDYYTKIVTNKTERFSYRFHVKVVKKGD